MPPVEKRIVVVDDDAGIRTSLARILRASGYDVRVAKDGFEAMEVSASFSPRLLLIDMRMPGINGVDTFRQLQHQVPSLVAIFMTAYPPADGAGKAAVPGTLPIQSKPLDINALLSTIESTFHDDPKLGHS